MLSKARRNTCSAFDINSLKQKKKIKFKSESDNNINAGSEKYRVANERIQLTRGSFFPEF